ncbi:cytochrome C [Candidatus Methylacidiphilum fumarolicum]|nr:c-type cytochrome [Candidatus Methylacidiphilum fumarolicum]TFE70549.1 cytochrome C [Candidatus Methylacidiphilum fumarolicum]TFE74824.1 cytochrome C [Candidatus Methylacidiphilum fumarolicum]TFE76068.1 cytochrome C [Candidatus Methylacidiphilum fumarolicum]TFE76435.1 cytochrome C [Candidatus Methylacidiphilum fumarolicum]
MVKRFFSLLCLLLNLLFLASLFFAYSLIRKGFTARSTPPALEKIIATTALSLSIPQSVKEMKNPIPYSQAVLDEARDHFADHCALCHGNNGSGETPVGQNLYPKPTDLRSKEAQKKSDGEIYYIIHNGIRWTGMPAWGEAKEPDEDSWKLVHFIRHLPYLTKEEEEKMKKMNPISPHEIQEEKEEEKFLEEDNSLGNASKEQQEQ